MKYVTKKIGSIFALGLGQISPLVWLPETAKAAPAPASHQCAIPGKDEIDHELAAEHVRCNGASA